MTNCTPIAASGQAHRPSSWLGSAPEPSPGISDGIQPNPVPSWTDPALPDRPHAEVCEIGQTATIDLADVLGGPPENCLPALRALVGLPGSPVFRATDGGEHSCLFTACAASMVGGDDLARFERALRAAIYAAGLTHPLALPAACSRILSRLRELGVAGYTLAELKKSAAAAVAAAGETPDADESDPIAVKEVCPDAPCSDDLLVPPRWEISDGGIRLADSEDPCGVSDSPVLITHRYSAAAGDFEFVGLAWRDVSEWRTQIVPRLMIADKTKIVGLAAHGAPVNSNNAATMVQFLSEFESLNAELLPRTGVTQQLGWQDFDGQIGFLFGHELIEPAPETAASQTLSDLPATTRPRFIFRGADRGDEQLAHGFRRGGSLAGWRHAIEPIEAYLPVQLGIIASLSTPLLRLLEGHNFIVSYAGATSCGKTTTLRIAASCWGVPDERSPSSVIKCWDATRVSLERTSAACCDLPLIADDTKRARRHEDIGQMLYDVAQGRGRGRGTLAGLQEVSTFQTILISSGEQSITTFSQDGGIVARVFELWGSPFGRTDAATGSVINQVGAGIRDNYGHAGPAFVRFLLDHRSEWPRWREVYAVARRGFEESAGGNSVARRMADHAALLTTTATIAGEADLLPWPCEGVVSQLWPELTEATPEADRAAAALRHVVSWAHGHRAEFFGTQRSHTSTPSQGFAGRWALGGVRGVGAGGYIAFLPHRLDAVLNERGFEADSVRRLWHGRGWLLTTPQRRDRYRVRLEGSDTPVDVIAITQAAIVEVMGPLDDRADAV